jgi:DNA-binding CsgD family transcriptional regulator
MDFYPGTDFEFGNLPRETQVIWLAMEGNTDKTIAQLLEITTDTVATYWKRILVRYDSSSRTEVIAQFLREYYEDELDHLEQQVGVLEEQIKAKIAAEQHQLLATAQLNSLMNLLDVGVLFTNNGLKVNYINEQLCRMAGCSLNPKELIGSDIGTFVDNCRIRAVKSEESATQRFRNLAASTQEKTVDQMVMTNGRTLERTFCNVVVRGSVIGHFIVYKDITPFVDETKELILKSKLNEQIVHRALVHLEAAPQDQTHEVVNSLACLGRVMGADLAIIAEADFRNGSFSVIHSWAKNEFEFHSDYEETIPLSFVEWFKKQLTERDYWVIDSISDLPKSASMERAICTEAGVRSAIAIAFNGPLLNKKYFVQFSSKKEGFWDRKIINSSSPIQRMFEAVFAKLEQQKVKSAE